MNIGLIVHTLILNEHSEVLILKRSSGQSVLPNIWDIPGGSLLSGEDPRLGALRETKEETGFVVDELSLFDYTHNIDKALDKQFIRLIFLATIKNAPSPILNPSEHTDYEWIPSSDPQNFELVDYLPTLLKKLC